MSIKDEAFLTLLELFPDIDTDVITGVIANAAGDVSQEALVALCIDEIFKESPPEDERLPTPIESESNEIFSLVSLIPATFKADTEEISLDSAMDVEEVKQETNEDLKIQTVVPIKDDKKIGDGSLGSSFQTTNSNMVAGSQLIVKRVNEHLQLMRKSMSKQTIENCLKLLVKVLTAILENPIELKYRTIKRGKSTWKNKVSRVPGAEDILAVAGFSKVVGQDEGLLVLEPSSVDSVRLFVVREVLQNWEVPMTESEALPVIRKPVVTSRPKTTFIQPKPKQLSPQQLREKRLRALERGPVDESYSGPAPVKGRGFDPSKPSLQKQIREIRKQKHRKYRNTRLARKRVFTMEDLRQLEKSDRAYKAKGPTQQGEMDNLGKEMLKYTNEFRAKHNLPPLKWSQPLAEIGKKHSKNMGDGKAPFSHDGFNARVRAYPLPSRAAAENLAMSGGLQNVARVAVDGWIDSPGHRRNLLHPSCNYCGIGVYRNLSDKYYSTQLFGLF